MDGRKKETQNKQCSRVQETKLCLTDREKKIYNEIIQLQKRGRYDLMYHKTEDMELNQNKAITFGTEKCKGMFITKQDKILNYEMNTHNISMIIKIALKTLRWRNMRR